jgi:hypothetical protein
MEEIKDYDEKTKANFAKLIKWYKFYNECMNKKSKELMENLEVYDLSWLGHFTTEELFKLARMKATMGDENEGLNGLWMIILILDTYLSKQLEENGALHMLHLCRTDEQIKDFLLDGGHPLAKVLLQLDEIPNDKFVLIDLGAAPVNKNHPHFRVNVFSMALQLGYFSWLPPILRAKIVDVFKAFPEKYFAIDFNSPGNHLHPMFGTTIFNLLCGQVVEQGGIHHDLIEFISTLPAEYRSQLNFNASLPVLPKKNITPAWYALYLALDFDNLFLLKALCKLEDRAFLELDFSCGVNFDEVENYRKQMAMRQNLPFTAGQFEVRVVNQIVPFLKFEKDSFPMLSVSVENKENSLKDLGFFRLAYRYHIRRAIKGLEVEPILARILELPERKIQEIKFNTRMDLNVLISYLAKEDVNNLENLQKKFLIFCARLSLKQLVVLEHYLSDELYHESDRWYVLNLRAICEFRKKFLFLTGELQAGQELSDENGRKLHSLCGVIPSEDARNYCLDSIAQKMPGSWNIENIYEIITPVSPALFAKSQSELASHYLSKEEEKFKDRLINLKKALMCALNAFSFTKKDEDAPLVVHIALTYIYSTALSFNDVKYFGVGNLKALKEEIFDKVEVLKKSTSPQNDIDSIVLFVNLKRWSLNPSSFASSSSMRLSAAPDSKSGEQASSSVVEYHR